MAKMMFAAAIAVIAMATPSMVISSHAQSQDQKLAQVEIGRGKTIEVGPKGITVGPKKKARCRTVTTTVERSDGRKVTKKERVCED